MIPTILCVEDELVLRKTIVEELTDAGYNAVEASNGAEGLEAINKYKPNLVICDVQMPIMDGNEMLISLRDMHPEYDSVPFLFLSGKSERNNIIEGRLRGADDYLAKPVDYTLLLATIESRLTSTARIEAKKQAELDELRSSILVLMPHELRTPLNHILGFSSLIKDETFGPIGNDKYVEYIDHIHESGENLMGIISNVLYLTDVISGNMNSDFVECNISTIINNCVDAYSEEASQNNLKINLSVEKNLPPTMATTEIMEKIISALLSNAIKFTPDDGNIAILAFLESENTITIVISDTGIGIDEVDIPKVIKAFGRVECGMTRSTDGSGIGLTLAKALTELIGGELSLQSAMGSGTDVAMRFNMQKNHNKLH